MPNPNPPARILHLEDSPRDAALIHDQLVIGGLACDVFHVDTGQRFEAALAGGIFDLILLDYNLPGYDGRAAMKLAQQRLPTVPLIVVSGMLDEEAAVECLRLGATDYVLKQRTARFVPAVQRALEEAEGHHRRRQAEADLRDSEAHLQRAQAVAQVGSWAIDIERAIVSWSAETYRIFAMTPGSPVTQEDFLARVHPDDLKYEDRFWRAALLEGTSYDLEHRILVGDAVKWVHRRAELTFDIAGRAVRAVGTVQDITQRKEAEGELRRLNRLYAMVSGINALGLRARDRDELFRNACKIAVEHGEFARAWIGLVDANDRIVPKAWAGFDEKAVAAVKALFSANGMVLNGKTLAAHAIREKTAVVSSDVQNHAKLDCSKNFGKSELHSLAVLPLVVTDKAIGVFVLHTNQPEFFDADGLLLLTELAGNIAFALDHIEKQERLDRFAYYDELTGLANRSLFLDRLTQHMLSAAIAGTRVAVFLLDLERFKKFNDSLGRPAGDALLKQFAEWLARNAGSINVVARVGADHFAVVLPEVTYEGEVAQLLEVLIASLLIHPFIVNDVAYRIAAKVGVAVFPDDGTDADTLFKNAEGALKKAKVSHDRYLFYAQKMTETLTGSLSIENRLRLALEQNEFVLHYQPKVNLTSGQLTGAEALIRWNDPQTGLVPPARFIPILEETGLIHEVGRWALRKAIEDHQHWLSAGLAAPRIAVNVSPLQLRNCKFVSEIEEAVNIAPNAAAGLELEITESLIMENVNHSIVSLLAIRALGITIAIDDFGTGFSSLSYLSKLPVDTIKIDRSFVVDMTSGTGGLTLVSVIINMAHALKLKVVAEGVETEEQLRQLRLLHCDEMQGYLFGKPVPREIFEKKFLSPAGQSSYHALFNPTARRLQGP